MIGDIVHVKGVRGSDAAKTMCRPAIILREWAPGDNIEDRHVGTVQLIVFPDGSNDVPSGEVIDQRAQWHTSVQHISKAPGEYHYHYPAECVAMGPIDASHA